jgi:hypothetical protein
VVIIAKAAMHRRAMMESGWTGPGGRGYGYGYRGFGYGGGWGYRPYYAGFYRPYYGTYISIGYPGYGYYW